MPRISTRKSVSPSDFDPTTVSGRPKPLLASGLPVDLVLDGPVVQKVSSISVRPDDKAVFDALQAWWLWRYGVRLTQWELFTRLLEEALAGEEGVFAGARDRV